MTNLAEKPAIDLPSKGGAIAVQEPMAIAITPMDMLDRAVQQGANIEVLEKLMALQERYEANQARKAFDEAIAQAKAEITPIKKNRKVGFESKDPSKGRTDYRYEDLAEIARSIDPILSKYSLNYRYRTVSTPGQPITVTCILSHRGGHSEENSLSAGADNTGNKNAIQAIGSTVVYLQRYTLKAALGLAASNDDDGKKAEPIAEPVYVSEAQIFALRTAIIENGGDIAKFCKAVKVPALENIFASKFDAAMQIIKAKKKAAS